MISSVAQSGFASPSNGTALNTTQSESLLALLSNYDSKNISQSDAKDIVSSIREIGIKSGKGLGDLLNQTGFKPRELAQKAGLRQGDERSAASQNDVSGTNGMPPPPPPAQTTEPNKFNDALSSLSRLVEKYEGTELSDDDWSSLYQELGEEGLDVSRPLISIML